MARSRTAAHTRSPATPKATGQPPVARTGSSHWRRTTSAPATTISAAAARPTALRAAGFRSTNAAAAPATSPVSGDAIAPATTATTTATTTVGGHGVGSPPHVGTPAGPAVPSSPRSSTTEVSTGGRTGSGSPATVRRRRRRRVGTTASHRHPTMAAAETSKRGVDPPLGRPSEGHRQGAVVHRRPDDGGVHRPTVGESVDQTRGGQGPAPDRRLPPGVQTLPEHQCERRPTGADAGHRQVDHGRRLVQDGHRRRVGAAAGAGTSPVPGRAAAPPPAAEANASWSMSSPVPTRGWRPRCGRPGRG